jgi:hypothetical protein
MSIALEKPHQITSVTSVTSNPQNKTVKLRSMHCQFAGSYLLLYALLMISMLHVHKCLCTIALNRDAMLHANTQLIPRAYRLVR